MTKAEPPVDEVPSRQLAPTAARALRAGTGRSTSVPQAAAPAVPAPVAAPTDQDVPSEDALSGDALSGDALGEDTLNEPAPSEDVSSEDVSSARPRSSDTSRARSAATVVTAVLAVCALALAVVAAVLWWRAGHSSARTTARTRDTVALAARLDIEAVNTSDYRHAAAALTSWESASTGPLHSQYEQVRASAITLIGQAKIVTTAQVLDAAVTALNVPKGTATVIASVNVRKQPLKGAAAVSRNRFRGTLRRVDGQWKLSDLAIVAVSLS